MGLKKIRKNLNVAGLLTLGAAGDAGWERTAANQISPINGDSIGTPTISGGTISGATAAFDALRVPAAATANGTSNLPVAQAGYIRATHNGATVQFGFVVDGTAYSLQGTANGAITLVPHA